MQTPEGAEGWEQLYNWYHLFGDDRRDLDEQRFWFQDRLHHPGVLHPYDEIQCECWWQALGAFNTRIFAMPPAFGVDQRILNGYLYVTPVPAPPESIPERAELFGRRGGHYYEHWDQIYAEWKEKVTAHLEEIKAIRFEPLPELEDESVVFDHLGYSSGYRMIEDFSKLVLTMYKTYQYHFELLNVGYAAYLTFFMFAKQAFGEITDQSISRMVGGLHVDLYRPDDELKRLAKEAERLGGGDAGLAAGDPGSLFDQLRAAQGERQRPRVGGRLGADLGPVVPVQHRPRAPGRLPLLRHLAGRPRDPAGLGQGVRPAAAGRRGPGPPDRPGPGRA